MEETWWKARVKWEAWQEECFRIYHLFCSNKKLDFFVKEKKKFKCKNFKDKNSKKIFKEVKNK